MCVCIWGVVGGEACARVCVRVLVKCGKAFGNGGEERTSRWCGEVGDGRAEVAGEHIGGLYCIWVWRTRKPATSPWLEERGFGRGVRGNSPRSLALNW